jgi:hypothetical protein
MPDSIQEAMVGVGIPNPHGLAVFTEGDELWIGRFGVGISGHWHIAANAHLSHLIIYHRTHGQNLIYRAEVMGIFPSPPDPPDRYSVVFGNATLLGMTANDWTGFAGPGQNPVRYWP